MSFRKMNRTEERSFERQLSFIYEIAEYVAKHFIGKKIFVVTEHETLQLNFKRGNLPHLLGIKYVGSEQQFWQNIKTHSLNPRSVEIQDYTFEKLQAMHGFQDLFEGEAMLTDKLELCHIVIDKALKTKKMVLAIGLDKDESRQFYFPRTAINLKNYRNDLSKGRIVLEVYTINRETGNKAILKQRED